METVNIFEAEKELTERKRNKLIKNITEYVTEEIRQIDKTNLDGAEKEIKQVIEVVCHALREADFLLNRDKRTRKEIPGLFK